MVKWALGVLIAEHFDVIKLWCQSKKKNLNSFSRINGAIFCSFVVGSACNSPPKDKPGLLMESVLCFHAGRMRPSWLACRLVFISCILESFFPAFQSVLLKFFFKKKHNYEIPSDSSWILGRRRRSHLRTI